MNHNIHKDSGYHRTKMDKEVVIQLVRDKGYRITKQREILIDIILQNQCTCCKEIYFQASKEQLKIGVATVYRMINVLEEIGAINRKNMFNIQCKDLCKEKCNETGGYVVTTDDNVSHYISYKDWNDVIHSGLVQMGYLKNQKVICIVNSD